MTMSRSRIGSPPDPHGGSGQPSWSSAQPSPAESLEPRAGEPRRAHIRWWHAATATPFKQPCAFKMDAHVLISDMTYVPDHRTPPSMRFEVRTTKRDSDWLMVMCGTQL